VAELLDAALERGELDVVAELAYPLPVRIICEMLGVPVADHERFQGWSAALARGLRSGVPPHRGGHRGAYGGHHLLRALPASSSSPSGEPILATTS